MSDQTGDEAKNVNIEKMGETLGALYSALWQAVAIIHHYWIDYVELFGTRTHCAPEQFCSLLLSHDPGRALGDVAIAPCTADGPRELTWSKR